MGSRSKARKRAVDLLYEADQRAADPVTLLADRMGATETPIHEYTERLIEAVSEDRQRIDELLSQHAEGWTLERMPAVDRAVLRLGVCELLHGDDVPPPVVIDEAVELVKALSTDDSPRFVNGVLGRLAGVVKNLRSAQAAAARAVAPDAGAHATSGGVGEAKRVGDAGDAGPGADTAETAEDDDGVTPAESASSETGPTETGGTDVAHHTNVRSADESDVPDQNRADSSTE